MERRSAHLDELTGTYRRGSGYVELQREVSRAVRTHQPLAVVFVDVDGLKLVNDTRGHAEGDRLLQQVAGALLSNMRAYDLVMRYGGDEFVCVMVGMTAQNATARLAEMIDALRSVSAHGSISTGVAELAAGDTADSLVARADDELYRGRGTPNTDSRTTY